MAEGQHQDDRQDGQRQHQPADPLQGTHAGFDASRVPRFSARSGQPVFRPVLPACF
jgi:hypothetical protein